MFTEYQFMVFLPGPHLKTASDTYSGVHRGINNPPPPHGFILFLSMYT